MELVRDEQEVNDVLNWASEGIDHATHFPGMSYEEGIQNAIYWLVGFADERPDAE